MWCPHCNNETKDLASIAEWQAQHRVAVLQIAMQGYSSASPTWTEVQKWVGDHNLAFPLLVDGQGAELGKSFPVHSVPVNIAVNPRTMEVLDVQIGEVGSPQSYEQGLLNSL
jgi:peroxiredoxin